MQTSYSDSPAAALAGMPSDLGLRETISRIVGTRKLVLVSLPGHADGVFTVTLDGTTIATFTASTSSAAAITADLLADVQASDEDVEATSVSSTSFTIELLDDDTEHTIAVNSTGTGADITATTLVPFGQTVPFGVGVVADPLADSPSTQCRLPRQAADITGGTFLGVSQRDDSREYNASGYADGAAIPILHRGRCWVSVEGTVADGGAVYCRYASGSGSQLGAFRADADSSTAALVPNAKFLGGRTGAGLVEIELL